MAEETTLAPSAKAQFAAAFREAVIDYRFGTEGPLVKPVTYVVAENGLFEVRMNAIGTFARRVEGVPGTGHVAAGFHPALPKIPWNLFEQAIAFFRAVMQRHGNAEAYIQILWNEEDGKYFAHVPPQVVSGGHVSFERNGALEALHVLVLEAHSHNTMGAFFSGTDNADEQGDRLFAVIGRLDRRIPQVRLRYGMAGHHAPLRIEEVFAAPDGEATQSWLDQVQSAKATRPSEVAGVPGGSRRQSGTGSRVVGPDVGEDQEQANQGLLFDAGELIGPAADDPGEGPGDVDDSDE